MSKRTPNDQRSDVHNKETQEHQAMLDNRSRQLNTEDEKFNGPEDEQ